MNAIEKLKVETKTSIIQIISQYYNISRTFMWKSTFIIGIDIILFI